MQVSIISPESTLYDAEAWSVSVPSKKAPFTALDGHAPIESALAAGKVEVCPEKDGEKLSFTIKGGFAEIHDNKAVICIEPAN